MTEKTLNAVNQHCLDGMMQLAETTQVTTSEDIFDSHGNKLLAKGAVLNGAMRERLICHKLHKPLETSLTVVDGVDTHLIVSTAEQLVETMPALAPFVGDQRTAIMEVLSRIQLESAAGLLLSTADKTREGSLHHSVLVSLLTASLGVHRKLPSYENSLLATAAMLHDIGELYIDPQYLRADRVLSPDEWKHVFAHPRVAQMVLSELTAYPPILIEAVGNHHERMNGSGYPRQLTSKELDEMTQILVMAETLSGILSASGDVLTRSCLALRCVPGEYPYALISLVSGLKRAWSNNPLYQEAVLHEGAFDHTRQLLARLEDALSQSQTLLQQAKLPSAVQKILTQLQQRLAELKQCMYSAGLNECLVAEMPLLGSDLGQEILLEVEVISREINWRMRNLARDLYIRLSNSAPQFLPQINPLISVLDQA